MKNLKILLVSVLSFFLCSSVYGNFDSSTLSGNEKTCFELIQESQKTFNFKTTTSETTKKSSNDGISGVDFLNTDAFTNKNYTYGNKSQLSRKDLFKIFELYDIDLSNSFFYDNELNFYTVNKDSKDEFLSCSFTTNKNLLGQLQNLKAGDVNVAYTTYSDVFDITEFEKDGTNWKKVDVTRTFMDALGKRNVLQIQTTYYIPENKNLKGYYDLYDMVSELKETNDWFKDRVSNLSQGVMNTSIKTIYNEDGIEIKAYFVGQDQMRDPYGISYISVNGKNFFNDYAEFKRFRVFDYLVNNNSPFAKTLTGIGNAWDDETNRRVEPQLGWDWWVKYFLGKEPLTAESKAKIQVQPYYTRKINYINNTYYKVYNSEVQIERPLFINYMYNNVFTEENLANPEKQIAAIKEVSIDGNYDQLKTKYKEFVNDYEKIEASKNKNDIEAFVAKYGDEFGSHWYFQTDMIQDVVANQSPDDNSDKTNVSTDTEVESSNTMYIVVGVLLLLVVLIAIGFIFRKKK